MADVEPSSRSAVFVGWTWPQYAALTTLAIGDLNIMGSGLPPRRLACKTSVQNLITCSLRSCNEKFHRTQHHTAPGHLSIRLHGCSRALVTLISGEHKVLARQDSL